MEAQSDNLISFFENEPHFPENVSHVSEFSIFLSTSIYDLVLIYVCHFHHHFLQLPLLNFDYYRDTRAYIWDLALMNFVI